MGFWSKVFSEEEQTTKDYMESKNINIDVSGSYSYKISREFNEATLFKHPFNRWSVLIEWEASAELFGEKITKRSSFMLEDLDDDYDCYKPYVHTETEAYKRLLNEINGGNKYIMKRIQNSFKMEVDNKFANDELTELKKELKESDTVNFNFSFKVKNPNK